MRVGVEPKGDPHRLRQALQVGHQAQRTLHFAWPLQLTPTIVPIQPVVIFEPQPQQSPRDLLDLSSRKGIDRNYRVAPPEKDVFSGLRVLAEEKADFAKIALAGFARRVVVRSK